MGADDRSAEDHLARRRGDGRENPVARAVQVSAAGSVRLSNWPDADRWRFARPVGRHPAGVGDEGLASRCRLSDDLDRRVGGPGALLHYCPDRAPGPPRFGDVVHGVQRPRHGRARLSLRRLYRPFLFQTFFGSANYSVVGPYMAEIWPARLRASGMGLSYGVGNLGKFVGPLGLALIMGAGDLIKPAAPNLVMLGPAFMYFASWYALGLIGFWVFGYEPRGRTFEEIDDALDTPVRTAVAGSAFRR